MMLIEKNFIVLLFLLIFVSALALFHTLLCNAVTHKKIRPVWILFAVYNGIGAALFFIEPEFTVGWIIFLFGIIILGFILGLIFGIGTKIYAGIKNIITGKDKEPIYKKIRNLLLGALLIGLFLSFGPFLFPIIVVVIIVKSLSENRSRFLKLQAILATSKIRSMSMGLVEVEGQVKGIELLFSPIDSKKCLAYTYEIEKISRDDDGRESFSTIHTESKCNRFIITDDSGSVDVDPDKLRLEMFPIDEQYRSGGKRYTQRLLKNDDFVLLVGKASLEDNKPLIVYEEYRKVFGIAPANSVTLWNRFKPLRSTMLLYLTIFAFFVALILSLSMKEVDGQIVVSFTNELFTELNIIEIWKRFLH